MQKLTKVSKKSEILTILQKHEDTLRGFGVRRYGLFGSFFNDQASEKSDVDLLVEFESEKKTFTNFFNLLFFLEALFGRPVELVTLESLSPHIGPKILKDIEYVTIGS